MKRYLPEKAWDLLSEEEKQDAEKKKESGDEKGEQFVENTVAAKAARAFVDHGDASELSQQQMMRLRKKELMQIAREQEIAGRSSLDKESLAKAIVEHFANRPAEKTRDELYEEAQQLGIDGRSEMDKAALAEAVQVHWAKEND
jgi:hypothetical protein